MGHKTTAQALRDQLMAPQAIERVHAMHALELELEEAPACQAAQDLEAFTARGIRYYAPEDPEYRAWVAQAVSHWERLHAAIDKKAAAPKRAARPAPAKAASARLVKQAA